VFRAAVVIFAVVESPGRKSGGGSVTVNDDFEILASSLPYFVENSYARRANDCVIPISETIPWKTFLGIASMVTSAG